MSGAGRWWGVWRGAGGFRVHMHAHVRMSPHGCSIRLFREPAGPAAHFLTIQAHAEASRQAGAAPQAGPPCTPLPQLPPPPLPHTCSGGTLFQLPAGSSTQLPPPMPVSTMKRSAYSTLASNTFFFGGGDGARGPDAWGREAWCGGGAVAQPTSCVRARHRAGEWLLAAAVGSRGGVGWGAMGRRRDRCAAPSPAPTAARQSGGPACAAPTCRRSPWSPPMRMLPSSSAPGGWVGGDGGRHPPAGVGEGVEGGGGGARRAPPALPVPPAPPPPGAARPNPAGHQSVGGAPRPTPLPAPLSPKARAFCRRDQVGQCHGDLQVGALPAPLVGPQVGARHGLHRRDGWHAQPALAAPLVQARVLLRAFGGGRSNLQQQQQQQQQPSLGRLLGSQWAAHPPPPHPECRQQLLVVLWHPVGRAVAVKVGLETVDKHAHAVACGTGGGG